ncbi:glutamine synthetase [Enhydrobacter aerosaccus]|uniref:Glutamine synthetase n=1 Tax=Enhydrobacter aerosaccus TaxID=225324 RepID=A0A1T4KSH5_9HYPH|nr:glutamine synthetase family protein [Enhydrobacter aerosaccus]SJZ45382.1 glutamine synthetase [Enhydrobacter aerosaccus]
MSLAEKAGLWNKDHEAVARDVERRIQADGITVVRLSFADQHGLLRGKTLVAPEAVAAMTAGVGFTTTMLLKDTAHRTVFPVWQAGGGFGMKELEGAADVMMLPDPSTFRVLPWAPHTGWMLCDIVFADGRPMPLSTRHLYRQTLSALADAGYDFCAGLEVEFHLFKLEKSRLGPTDAGQPGEAPDVSLLNQGYQYLTEQRYDAMDPILEILRANVADLGLPLRSIEVEFGPSQVEFTFRAGIGMEPADAMILFRSAAKQVAARHGYHATFMCRPKLANVMSSGWHLHQSLKDRKSGINAFADPQQPLSAVGKHYMAGLLINAQAATAFSTPTLNGYKRYRPFSLAPDRAIWGRDNRGVMVRVLGGPGDASTHLENRVGEPAANPYLYMASQIVCGLDGLKRKADPGPSADTPYEAKATLLPRTLDEALDALRANTVLRSGLGDFFIDYYLKLKQAEIDRFNLEVTDWEQREYFSTF